MIFNSGDGRLRRVSAFVTPDSPPGPARSFILHGCRSHVAGAAWMPQPCSLIRCCRGGR